MCLEILGLDSVIEEEVIKSDDSSKEEDGTKPEVDPKRAAKDKRIKSIIKMSLSDQIIRKVTKEDTALGIWKALEKDYQTKSRKTLPCNEHRLGKETKGLKWATLIFLSVHIMGPDCNFLDGQT